MCQIDVCTCTRLFETMPGVQPPPSCYQPPFLRALHYQQVSLPLTSTIVPHPPPGPCPFPPCPIIPCVLSRLNPYHPHPPLFSRPTNHPPLRRHRHHFCQRSPGPPDPPLLSTSLSCPSSSSSSFLPAVPLLPPSVSSFLFSFLC